MQYYDDVLHSLLLLLLLLIHHYQYDVYSYLVEHGLVVIFVVN